MRVAYMEEESRRVLANIMVKGPYDFKQVGYTNQVGTCRNKYLLTHLRDAEQDRQVALGLHLLQLVTFAGLCSIPMLSFRNVSRVLLAKSYNVSRSLYPPAGFTLSGHAHTRLFHPGPGGVMEEVQTVSPGNQKYVCVLTYRLTVTS